MTGTAHLTQVPFCGEDHSWATAAISFSPEGKVEVARTIKVYACSHVLVPFPVEETLEAMS